MDTLSLAGSEQTMLLSPAEGPPLCGARQALAHPHLSFPYEAGRRTQFQYGQSSASFIRFGRSPWYLLPLARTLPTGTHRAELRSLPADDEGLRETFLMLQFVDDCSLLFLDSIVSWRVGTLRAASVQLNPNRFIRLFCANETFFLSSVFSLLGYNAPPLRPQSGKTSVQK